MRASRSDVEFADNSVVRIADGRRRDLNFQPPGLAVRDASSFEDHDGAVEDDEIFEFDFEDPVLLPVPQTGGRGRYEPH